MRILFVEDDDGFRNLYVMVLENLIKDVEITECISGNRAVEVLADADNEFDLIICDFEMADGNGDVVYNFLKEREENIHFILFSTSTISRLGSFQDFLNYNQNSIYISKTVGVNGFKEKLFTFLSNGIEKVTFIEEAYKRVRIYHFWRFNRVLCDVYLKLSDKKYVKIINKLDYYSKKDVDRYVRKKQKHFYISNDDYGSFGVTLREASFLILDKEKVKNYTREELVANTHAIMHELLKTVGISDSVLKLAEHSVAEVTENLTDDNELLVLLVKSRERRDYLYDHSYLVSCICCNICSKMDWYNRENLHKLCMAAIFHDLLLDDSRLAMVDNLDDEYLLEFSTEKQKLYLEHPSKTAQMIRNSERFMANVDDIIEQHHEKPDGTGFPRGLSHSRISQLVCVFIIAHDFIDRLYEIDFDEAEFNSVLIAMSKKYDQGNFKNPVIALVEGFGTSLIDTIED